MQDSMMKPSLSLLFMAVLALGAMLFMPAAPAAEQRAGSTFNHIQTGFPLLGAHAQTDCQTCHLQGVFKGTPRQCEVCHTQGSRIASTFKPRNHPQTAMPCNQCHVSQVSWSGARFDHIGIAPGSCAGCHNGVTASGKSTRHIFTTSSCDVCHRTTAWVPAGYNHSGVLPGTCSTCHGVTATGKPGGHVVTALECDQCHSTRNWGFTHPATVPGQCSTCHGVTATGKPGGHIATALECDQCHSTRGWRPAQFNHSGVVPGTCEALCHRVGGGATPRPGGSHPATGSCDACHSTRNWNFSHAGAVAGQCNTCHGVTATPMNNRHIPTALSCDACHNTRSFSTNTFRHTIAQGVLPTQCNTCHTGGENGTYNGAKGPKDDSEHRQADHAICDNCHVTTTWDPIGGNRVPIRRKANTRKR